MLGSPMPGVEQNVDTLAPTDRSGEHHRRLFLGGRAQVDGVRLRDHRNRGNRRAHGLARLVAEHQYRVRPRQHGTNEARTATRERRERTAVQMDHDGVTEGVPDRSQDAFAQERPPLRQMGRQHDVLAPTRSENASQHAKTRHRRPDG